MKVGLKVFLGFLAGIGFLVAILSFLYTVFLQGLVMM